MRPNRFPSPGLLACGLALVLASLAPAPSRADYKDSYLEGREAAAAGDWAKVARSMEEAIAEEPQASERTRFYGMRFEFYVPHYYLGVARSQLGDCEGALEAWEVSTAQGVIQTLEEYGTLQRLRGGCEERLTEAGVEEVEVVEEDQRPPPVPQPPPTPVEPTPSTPGSVLEVPPPEAVSRAVEGAEAAIGEAERQARRLGQLREDPDLSDTWGSTPSLTAPAGSAAQLLERARSRLAAGREGPDLEALEEARSLAVQAQEAFSGVIRQADARRQQILQEKAEQAEIARLEAEREAEEERRRTELREEIAVAAREADRLLGRTRGQGAELQEVGRTRGALEQALARTEELEGLDSVADLEGFRDALARATGRYEEALDEARRLAERAAREEGGEVPAGPPEALRAAARAYFNGDYWEVLGALSGQEFQDETVAAHARLFRAAAHYALYLLSGEEEETLAEEAREDLAFCRRLDPDLIPDPEAFSPRFIAFFERDE